MTSHTDQGVFHEGEKAVQQRAGVASIAARLGPLMVQPELDPDFADFLEEQPFLIVASHTRTGQAWASVLTGAPGFAMVASSQRLVVHADIADDDPLADALTDGPTQLGLLVLEPMSRGRIRLNGIGKRTQDGIELELAEVFGNCPKYIQRRVPTELDLDVRPEPASVTDSLSLDQMTLIRRSDTFFIASTHPTRGADASHRGGQPGFVVVHEGGQSLTFPDYQGNNMFQTLGNLTANPTAGLLFLEWDAGRTLQMTGQAEVIWDEERIKAWPRAERLVDVHVSRVIDRVHGSALHWQLIEAHRLNPPTPQDVD
jgi:predicted pyridoxine 5'-phosphate oxidase superfamily flavin-nucleotide-binding protein